MQLICLFLQEFPGDWFSHFLYAAILGNALYIIAAIVVIVALWRAMRAHERLADAMEEIAKNGGQAGTKV